MKDGVYTFTGSESECEIVYNILSVNNPTLIDHATIIEDALFLDGNKSGFKPLILLPQRLTCCGRKAMIRLV